MKKNHLSALATLSFFAVIIMCSGHAAAAVLYSQDIILNPGWNIVSTPKVLDSFSFSVANTSDNFDIYTLNPTSLSGWSTMADLGQSTFVPLYGYFIRNKTGSDQTLTFNYSADTTPSDRLFTRTFPSIGWYALGIANPSYALGVGAGSADTNNPNTILNGLLGATSNYGTVIDFTDASYPLHKDSVALLDPWKTVERAADVSNTTDINSLHDFRETKGYGIFIKQAGSVYNGLQDNSIHVPATPSDLELAVALSSSTPPTETVKASTTANTNNVQLLKFTLNAQGGAMHVNQIPIMFTTSNGSGLAAVTGNVTLTIGGSSFSESVISTSTSATVTFDDLDIDIGEDETITGTVSVDINSLGANNANFAEGTTLAASVGDLSGFDAEDEDGNPVLSSSDDITGSAVGEVITFRSAGVTAVMGNSSTTISVDQSGNVNQVQYSIPITVTSFGDTFYIGQSAQLASTVSGSNAFALAFQTSVAPTSDEVTSSASIALASSDAVIESNAFRIDEDETKHFVITVALITPSSTNSNYRIQLKQIKTFTNALLSTGAAISDLLPIEEYRSNYSFINN